MKPIVFCTVNIPRKRGKEMKKEMGGGGCGRREGKEREGKRRGGGNR